MSRRSLGAWPAVAAVVLSLLATAAQADPQQGGRSPGEGEKRGRRCGNSLIVVNADGTVRTLERPTDLLEGMPMRMIEQGEKPRPGIKVEDALARLGAASMEATTCRGQKTDFPSGLPFEGDVYLVVTGRGGLKFVKEIRPGTFVNVLQDIERLRLVAKAAGPASPVPDRKR